MTEDEWVVFEGLLDGVEGYLAETGRARYWKMEVVVRARQLVANRALRKKGRGKGDPPGESGSAARTPRPQ